MKRVVRNRLGESKSIDNLDQQQTGSVSSPSSFGAMARQAANKEHKDESSLVDDSTIREMEKDDVDR
jgi:hypothetical protein